MTAQSVTPGVRRRSKDRALCLFSLIITTATGHAAA